MSSYGLVNFLEDCIFRSKYTPRTWSYNGLNFFFYYLIIILKPINLSSWFNLKLIYPYKEIVLPLDNNRLHYFIYFIFQHFCQSTIYNLYSIAFFKHSFCFKLFGPSIRFCNFGNIFYCYSQSCYTSIYIY